VKTLPLSACVDAVTVQHSLEKQLLLCCCHAVHESSRGCAGSSAGHSPLSVPPALSLLLSGACDGGVGMAWLVMSIYPCAQSAAASLPLLMLAGLCWRVWLGLSTRTLLPCCATRCWAACTAPAAAVLGTAAAAATAAAGVDQVRLKVRFAEHDGGVVAGSRQHQPQRQ